jgi:hypothetical protein
MRGPFLLLGRFFSETSMMCQSGDGEEFFLAHEKFFQEIRILIINELNIGTLEAAIFFAFDFHVVE